jgi:electron-transferring-flavoprotein dehydrogenase
MTITKGAFPGGHWGAKPDSEHGLFIGDRAKSYPKPDNKYLFDKLSSVFASGNATRDDAPNHIRVQHTVPLEIAQGWAAMCPAQVYELPEELELSADGEVTVQITPSNCVQCGAITAKGGRLTPPEGGDGPMYTLA